MVTKQFEAKQIVMPADTVDNACHALRQLAHWVNDRQLTKTPVLQALLAHAQRALINLDAAMRMSERNDRGFQPNDTGMLHIWMTVEDVLKERFGINVDGGTDELPGATRNLYYACERACWDRLPADARAMNLAEVICYTRNVIQQTLEAWTAPARYATPPAKETPVPQVTVDDAAADALEAAARFDRAVAA